MPFRFGKGTWAGAGTIDTAFPEAGAAPDPVGPEAGVLHAALTAGAARATRPGPTVAESAVAASVVGRGSRLVEVEVLVFLLLPPNVPGDKGQENGQ